MLPYIEIMYIRVVLLNLIFVLLATLAGSHKMKGKGDENTSIDIDEKILVHWHRIHEIYYSKCDYNYDDDKNQDPTRACHP